MGSIYVKEYGETLVYGVLFVIFSSIQALELECYCSMLHVVEESK